MPYQLSDQEKEGVLSAPDDKAYSYFVSKAADWQEIWSLSDGENFASLTDDEGQVYFPVWPHPEFAGDVAIGEWDGYEPKLIEVHDFLDWCKRFEADDSKVAILHRPSGDYITVPPGPLAEDLQAALDEVE